MLQIFLDKVVDDEIRCLVHLVRIEQHDENRLVVPPLADDDQVGSYHGAVEFYLHTFQPRVGGQIGEARHLHGDAGGAYVENFPWYWPNAPL